MTTANHSIGCSVQILPRQTCLTFLAIANFNIPQIIKHTCAKHSVTCMTVNHLCTENY